MNIMQKKKSKKSLKQLLKLDLNVTNPNRHHSEKKLLERSNRLDSFPETCSNKCLFFSSASCNLVLDNIMQEEFLEKIQYPDFKSKVFAEF